MHLHTSQSNYHEALTSINSLWHVFFQQQKEINTEIIKIKAASVKSLADFVDNP